MRALLSLLSAALWLAACASGPPMGVERVDSRTAHRHLTANALSADEPSAPSAQLLRRLGLWDRFTRDPDSALAELRAGLPAEGAADRVYALAELSYLHGERARDRAHLLSAAVYAFAFLFPGDAASPPEAFDPRLRVAVDLYNHGLAEGLHTGEGERVSLEGGTFELPIGTLHVERAKPVFAWAGHELYGFRSAADYGVRGLRNRYRDPGIGAPLAARLRPFAEGGEAPPGAERIPPQLKIPVTALLRIERPREALAEGTLRGALELYSLDDVRRVTIAGRDVPLEFETTSSLALSLQETEAWEFEKAGFFSGVFRPEALRSRSDGHGLFFLRPWRPGRIPLVLVHGTASSPARWAELINELENDPRIWERYQTWLFIYNTGNPVALSGALLREALTDAVDELDPERRDAGLERMVVIGHSQGGLLTKLTAVDTGDRLWRNVSDEPFEQVAMSDETRSLLRRALFVEPLPFVKRIVFVSTPHHGSFLNAVTWAGLRPSTLLSRLITLPMDVARVASDLVAEDPELSLRKVPTSIDNMTPGNPFLETLAGIPVAPGITAHSIIPVKGRGPYQEGNDGVVEYKSAHHPGVASELVVQPSSHSTQSHPETIEEIRRILLLHAVQQPHSEGSGPASAQDTTAADKGHLEAAGAGTCASEPPSVP
jgi:pimeloyl-ACP methyl ester carboxylesterase